MMREDDKATLNNLFKKHTTTLDKVIDDFINNSDKSIYNLNNNGLVDAFNKYIGDKGYIK